LATVFNNTQYIAYVNVSTVLVNPYSNYASSPEQSEESAHPDELSLGSLSLPNLDAASKLFPINEQHDPYEEHLVDFASEEISD
jgi:hypothetical protein